MQLKWLKVDSHGHHQAKEYDLDGVKAMLDETPELVNVQPAGRWSALHQFAEQGEADAVRSVVCCKCMFTQGTCWRWELIGMRRTRPAAFAVATDQCRDDGYTSLKWSILREYRESSDPFWILLRF